MMADQQVINDGRQFSLTNKKHRKLTLRCAVEPPLTARRMILGWIFTGKTKPSIEFCKSTKLMFWKFCLLNFNDNGQRV